VLVVSSAAVLASEIESALGPAYEVHAAAADDAAATLLNTHEYNCVVLDVRPTSSAGAKTARTMYTEHPTILFAARPDTSLIEGATVVVESDVDVAELVAAIKSSRR
jgi:DNA-binding response OmpR family regulator